MSRNTIVPGGNPSRLAFAAPSRASFVPLVAASATVFSSRTSRPRYSTKNPKPCSCNSARLPIQVFEVSPGGGLIQNPANEKVLRRIARIDVAIESEIIFAVGGASRTALRRRRAACFRRNHDCQHLREQQTQHQTQR